MHFVATLTTEERAILGSIVKVGANAVVAADGRLSTEEIALSEKKVREINDELGEGFDVWVLHPGIKEIQRLGISTTKPVPPHLIDQQLAILAKMPSDIRDIFDSYLVALFIALGESDGGGWFGWGAKIHENEKIAIAEFLRRYGITITDEATRRKLMPKG